MYCASDVTIAANLPPGVLEDASPVVHELYNTVVNQVTGDIFWTEDLSRRVLVLRSGASQPMRIAGTGAEGIDAGGVVDPGAIALNTALAVPSSITLDSSGDPVFLDGYSPGRILRLLPSGALEVILALATSPSISAPTLDGPLSVATAYSLSGFTFVNNESAILFADTNLHSFVRRVDFSEGTVTRILGSDTGDTTDGHPLLQTVFSSITAVVALPGGAILIADAGVNVLRVGVMENATFVSSFNIKS